MDRVTIFLFTILAIAIITAVGVFLMNHKLYDKEPCEAAGGKLVHFRHDWPACLNRDVFIKVN